MGRRGELHSGELGNVLWSGEGDSFTKGRMGDAVQRDKERDEHRRAQYVINMLATEVFHDSEYRGLESDSNSQNIAS